jgi:hypothetical protein
MRAAGAAPDPVQSLRVGCRTWLRSALEPEIQRIVLLDAPAVIGWARWREIDEQRTLGGLRRNLELIAAQGRLADGDIDVLAHMVLASVSEAALLIACSEHPRAALRAGERAVDLMLAGLVREPSISTT